MIKIVISIFLRNNAVKKMIFNHDHMPICAAGEVEFGWKKIEYKFE